MLRILSRRRSALAVVATLTLAGVAYGFWTNGGSGSGTATVGTQDDNLAIAATYAGSLVPGGSQNVQMAINNPNTYTSRAKSVTLDTTQGGGNGIVITGAGTGNGGCDEAWFHYNGDAPFAFPSGGLLIAPGATPSVAAGAVSMDNLPTTNQDDCKTASVAFHFVVDNS